MEVKIGRIGSLSHYLQSFFPTFQGVGAGFLIHQRVGRKCATKIWGVLFILSLGKSMEIRVVLWPQKLTNIWVNKSERSC